LSLDSKQHCITANGFSSESKACDVKYIRYLEFIQINSIKTNVFRQRA